MSEPKLSAGAMAVLEYFTKNALVHTFRGVFIITAPDLSLYVATASDLDKLYHAACDRAVEKAHETGKAELAAAFFGDVECWPESRATAFKLETKTS